MISPEEATTSFDVTDFEFPLYEKVARWLKSCGYRVYGVEGRMAVTWSKYG